MARPSATRQALAFAASLLGSFLAGGIGALATVDAQSFYGQLVQPSWAPPSWLFGPVWTTLYTLMAIGAWLVWRAHGPGARRALTLYAGQLAVNTLWSWLFFAWRQGAWAFVEVCGLWLLIAATIWMFWRLNRMAAYLLVPYIAWVTFAAALNLALWRMNPGLLG